MTQIKRSKKKLPSHSLLKIQSHTHKYFYIHKKNRYRALTPLSVDS